jgi:hypothetical protein
MAEIVRIEGLKELEAALAELPKATARNTLKRSLTKGADIVDAAAQQNAPQETGKLERSVIVGSRLTLADRPATNGRTARASRRYTSERKSLAACSPSSARSRTRPQMWFTRAWESTQEARRWNDHLERPRFLGAQNIYTQDLPEDTESGVVFRSMIRANVWHTT